MNELRNRSGMTNLDHPRGKFTLVSGLAVVLHQIPLAKRLEPLGLDGGIMDEHIRPTILGSNEPVAATYIEEFNRSLVSSFVKDSVKANDS